MTTTRTATRRGPESAALRRDAEELHAALSTLVRVHQYRDRDRICCHDISVTQCYALETLADGGPRTLNALAASLFLDKSTASRVVSSLERKGYVGRESDPEDGRAVRLSATGAGRRLVGRITNDLVDETVELLHDQPAEVREGAARLLRRLAAAAAKRSGLPAIDSGCCAPSASARGDCGS